MHGGLYFTIDNPFFSKRQHEASLTSSHSGIGLETCILFAKEGANVLMADISAPALEKASAKLKQLVPSAHKVDIQVGCFISNFRMCI
jgi:NAD(P)-dependent dehydrogenase (short-subunit alcohol dehydrogenase family)